YLSVSRVAYENEAERFWRRATGANIATAVAGENSAAATSGMKWIGQYTHAAGSSANVYLALSLRVKVPGDPGTVARTLKLRLAAPTGITTVKYAMNQARGTMAEQSVTLTANQVLEKQHSGFRAGEEVRVHVTVVVPKNEYESYKSKFVAVQLVDVESGATIKQTDVDTPFMVYTDNEMGKHFGLVYKAVRGQWTGLPSEPTLVVSDGYTGSRPPVISQYADGTLTVYVATTYDAVNPAQTRDIDKLQFNLMFTS
ncbi:hypothetical protein, partial [Escherichia coli]|uniref:hypothetical protein n=1 Tax=Escherichia coli TaxID=562 RepID=UPI000A249782